MIFRLAVVCVLEIAVALVLVFALTAPASAGIGDTSAPRAEPPRRSTDSAPDAHTDREPLAARPSAAATPTPTDAERKGAAPDADAVRTVAVAKMQPGDPVGVLLTGTVRWRDGGAVADPGVYATSGKLQRRASGAKDGSFALAGLQPGEWTFRVSADGSVPAEESVTIADDAVQQRDFALERSFPVRVMIVTPDGQDAARAAWTTLRTMPHFSVAGQRDRFPDRLAPTDYGVVFVGDAKWDGEMNPEKGFAGTLSFAARPPAYAALLLRHLVIEQQLVQPDQKEVRFVVDLEALKARLGSATVRVVDAGSGAPLASATVSLYTSNAGSMGKPVDADGRAVVESLLPGLLQCSISAKEHESMYATVRVEPGQRLDLGEVRLGAQQNLTGRVFDADGKPAAATLTWTELKWRTAPTSFVTNRIARAEADGTFQIWGTGVGAIAVTARAEDGRIAAGVFDNPPATPIELRLAAPAECTITRPADPTRAFTVTFYDAQRRAVAAVTLEPRWLKTNCSLPAGDHAFDVHDDNGRLVQSGTLTFGANPCTLEIR